MENPEYKDLAAPLKKKLSIMGWFNIAFISIIISLFFFHKIAMVVFAVILVVFATVQSIVALVMIYSFKKRLKNSQGE